MKKELVPAALALQYNITRTLVTIAWLEEIDEKWNKQYKAKEDGSKTQTRARILADIISVYVSTLTEETGSGHSLIKSYPSNDFFKNFMELPIVQKCKMNRHNRSGHESKSYGHFVSPKEILDSDLKSWLSDAQVFIV